MATATAHRITGWDAAALWKATAGGRSIEILPDRLHVVGGASTVTLNRKTACRVCGEAMRKGATAVQFAYRFYPDSHPYRITEAFIHAERCR